MTEPVEKWVPVTEFPGLNECDENSRLTWDFDLPPSLDADRILLNTRMLKSIQKAAAFSSSHVISYDGETTQYTPGVSGINSDGTARAAMTGQLHKAPKTKTHIRDEIEATPVGKRVMQEHFKAETFNALNKPELASMVADGRDSGKSREERWASALDGALKQSLREGAKQHLLNRQSVAANIFDGFLYGNGAFGLAAASMSHDTMAINEVAALATLSIIFQEGICKYLTGQLLLKERRWSLAFLGAIQPDRYVVADALTRTGSLVRARQ